MFCPKCGTQVVEGIKSCPKCGHDMSNVKKASSSSDSITGKWSSFSTGKKIIAVIAVCCIGLLIIGLIGSALSPDENTSSYKSSSSGSDYSSSSSSSSSSYSSSSSSSSNDGVGDSALQVKVIYSGSWDGAVGTIDSDYSVSGSGSKVLNIDGSRWDTCSAVIQKADSGNGKLTVQIIKNGKVKKQSSTTASYGVVSVVD